MLNPQKKRRLLDAFVYVFYPPYDAKNHMSSLDPFSCRSNIWSKLRHNAPLKQLVIHVFLSSFCGMGWMDGWCIFSLLFGEHTKSNFLM